MRAAGVLYSLHTDHLGSVTLTTCGESGGWGDAAAVPAVWGGAARQWGGDNRFSRLPGRWWRRSWGLSSCARASTTQITGAWVQTQ